MATGATIRITWLLDVVDRGASEKVLAQDRLIRRSVGEVNREYERSAAVAGSAASSYRAAADSGVGAARSLAAAQKGLTAQYAATALTADSLAGTNGLAASRTVGAAESTGAAGRNLRGLAATTAGELPGGHALPGQVAHTGQLADAAAVAASRTGRQEFDQSVRDRIAGGRTLQTVTSREGRADLGLAQAAGRDLAAQERLNVARQRALAALGRYTSTQQHAVTVTRDFAGVSNQLAASHGHVERAARKALERESVLLRIRRALAGIPRAAADAAGAAGSGVAAAAGGLLGAGKYLGYGVAGAVGGAAGLTALGLHQANEVTLGARGLTGLAGIPAREATALAVIAKAVGVNTRSLGQTFGTLGKQVLQAEKGLRTGKPNAATEAFAALAITPTQIARLKNNLPALIDLVYQQAKRLPEAQRAGYVKQVLGRGGVSIPQIEAGGSLAAQISQIRGESAINPANLLKLHEAEIKLKEAAIGLELQFAQTFGPALVSLMQAATPLIKPFGEALQTLVKVPLEGIRAIWPELKAGAESAFTGGKEAAEAFFGALTGGHKEQPTPTHKATPGQPSQVPLVEGLPGLEASRSGGTNIGPLASGLGPTAPRQRTLGGQSSATLTPATSGIAAAAEEIGGLFREIGSSAVEAGEEVLAALEPATVALEQLREAAGPTAHVFGVTLVGAWHAAVPTLKLLAELTGNVAEGLKALGPAGTVLTGLLEVKLAAGLIGATSETTGLGKALRLLGAPVTLASRGISGLAKAAGLSKLGEAIGAGLRRIPGLKKVTDLITGEAGRWKGAYETGGGEAASGFVKRLTDKVASLGSKLKTAGVGIADSIAEGAGGLVTKLRGLIAKGIEYLPGPGPKGKGKEPTVAADRSVLKDIETVGKDAGEFFLIGLGAKLKPAALIGALRGFGPALFRALGVAGLAVLAADYGKRLVDFISKPFISGIDQIQFPAATALRRVVRGFPDAVSAGAGVVGHAASSLASEFVSKLTHPLDTLKGLFVSKLEHIAGPAGDAGRHLVEAVVGPFKSLGSKVGHFLGKVGAAIGKVASEVFDGFFNFGYGLIQAVISGIKSAPSAIVHAVESLIPKKLRGPVEKALEIGGEAASLLNPVSDAKKLFKRRGGYAFSEGGMVPAWVSPGEMIVHGGQSYMVPGYRTGADSVPMILPVGAAVLTSSGQQIMAQGAGLDYAVAHQAPHFQTGGFVATAYGPPWGGIQGNGTTATGIDLTKSPHLYIIATDPSVIATHSRVKVNPNPFGYTGAFAAEDTGGAIKGPRIDIYDWRGRADQDAWGRRTVSVERVGKGGAIPGTAAEKGGTVQVPIYEPASRTREGLLPDALAKGIEAGQAGLTPQEAAQAARGVKGARATPFIAAEAEALGTLTKAVSVTSASQKAAGKSAGKSAKGVEVPKASWNPLHKPIDKWIVPILAWASKHGWHGKVDSGYRTYAEQLQINKEGKFSALAGSSNHEKPNYPGGAVDVSDPGGMLTAMKGYNREPKLVGGVLGPVDPEHFSATGHRRGGVIGGYGAGGRVGGLSVEEQEANDFFGPFPRPPERPWHGKHTLLWWKHRLRITRARAGGIIGDAQTALPAAGEGTRTSVYGMSAANAGVAVNPSAALAQTRSGSGPFSATGYRVGGVVGHAASAAPAGGGGAERTASHYKRYYGNRYHGFYLWTRHGIGDAAHAAPETSSTNTSRGAFDADLETYYGRGPQPSTSGSLQGHLAQVGVDRGKWHDKWADNQPFRRGGRTAKTPTLPLGRQYREGGRVTAGPDHHQYDSRTPRKRFAVAGRASTFGPPGEAAGRTAYGLSSAEPGIAINPTGLGEADGWNSSLARSLALKWFNVTIKGRTARLRVIDKGPFAFGRRVDVTGAGAAKLGFRVGPGGSGFPTDAVARVVEARRGGWMRYRKGTRGAVAPATITSVVPELAATAGTPGYEGALLQLTQLIEHAAVDRLERLRAIFVRDARRGGTAAVVRSFQAAIDAIDFSIGRRIGRYNLIAEQVGKEAQRRQGAVDRRLRTAGAEATGSERVIRVTPGDIRRVPFNHVRGGSYRVSPAVGSFISGAELTQREDTYEIDQHKKALTAAKHSLALAKKTGNKVLIAEAVEKANTAYDEWQDAITKRIEDARAALKAAATERYEAAQGIVGHAQALEQEKENQRRAQGPKVTEAAGERAKAAEVSVSIIPALEAAKVAAVDSLKEYEKAGASAAELRNVSSTIDSAGVEISSALAEVAELTRQAAEGEAKEATETSQHEGVLAQDAQAKYELEQRINGTFESGGQARADFVKKEVVPKLEAEQVALEHERAVAEQQRDPKLAQQIAEAIAAKQNNLLEAQLEIQEDIKANTNQHPVSGSLGFQYGGENLTDSLIAVGNGA